MVVRDWLSSALAWVGMPERVDPFAAIAVAWLVLVVLGVVYQVVAAMVGWCMRKRRAKRR